MDNTDKKYSLEELSCLTDQSRRSIRYYIQIGLVDRPEGNRKWAWYTNIHVEQLLSIRKWQRAGFSLERIKEVMHPQKCDDSPPPNPPRKPGDLEVWSHIYISEGLEITIEPKRAGMTPEQLRAFCHSVKDYYESISRKGKK